MPPAHALPAPDQEQVSCRAVRLVRLAVLSVLLCAGRAHAQPWVSAELGPVFNSRNDVRIPGDEGTLFSLNDDLDVSPELYGRVQAGWDFGRHRVYALAAPLRVGAEGRLPRTVRFGDTTFAAGDQVEAKYQFDTYRLTYRYLALDRKGVQLGVGLTALLRVAAVELDDGMTRERKPDVGFVPLLHLELRYRPHRFVGFALVADGLASRQGRAFDVLAAVEGPVWRRLRPYLGYRFIEGGVDNDEVYNFSFLQFLAIGVDVSLAWDLHKRDRAAGRVVRLGAREPRAGRSAVVRSPRAHRW
jgi:hypothetical protein